MKQPVPEFRSRGRFIDAAYPGLAAALLFIIAAFSIYDLVDSDRVTAALGFIATALLGADLLHLRLRGRPLLHPALLFVLLSLICSVIIYRNGVRGIHWAYALLIAMPFLLERRFAASIAVAFIAGLAPLLGGIASNVSEAIRALSGLVLNGMFAFIFAELVHRQGRALEQEVVTDGLTGAFNRRHFTTRLEQVVEKKNRHGHPSSLILLDIDHFKGINDEYGHAAGDRVLRMLTDAIRARIRVLDELFRYGGEEFAVLLPDTSIEAAAKLAQDLTDMVAKIRAIAAGPVTVSCGVGELREGEHTSRWLDRCDFALYEAKRAGRGRIWIAPSALPAGIEPTSNGFNAASSSDVH